MTARHRPPFRVIAGLKWARRLRARPECIPIGRPRGVKALGMRFQRAFERALEAEFPSHGVEIGPWFHYADASGMHYCQPDALLYDIASDRYVICEVKLSDFALGARQIAELYAPVVSCALGPLPAGIVVTKNLASRASDLPIFDDFRGAYAHALGLAANEPFPLFHWLGKGRISTKFSDFRATSRAFPAP